jgi:hypothetical protein
LRPRHQFHKNIRLNSCGMAQTISLTFPPTYTPLSPFSLRSRSYIRTTSTNREHEERTRARWRSGAAEKARERMRVSSASSTRRRAADARAHPPERHLKMPSRFTVEDGGSLPSTILVFPWSKLSCRMRPRDLERAPPPWIPIR